MDGVKQIVAFLGLLIFSFSGKTLLTTTSNERAVRTASWFGLVFSTFLMNIETWMNVVTATFYATDLGPIYRVGADFNATRDALMIFTAAEVYVMAFGWFGFISSIFKLIEAPKLNSPGMKTRAVVGMCVAMACANIAVTINIVGGMVGVKNAYVELKNNLTK